MKETTRKTAEQIRAEAAEWDAANEVRKAKYAEQDAAYEAAKTAAFAPADTYIRERLAEVTLPLEIYVRQRWSDGVEVNVSAYDRDVHAANKALSWHMKIERGAKGGVKKETGSWSGLQATDAVQLEDLRETVKALEILNDIDWGTLLDIEVPKYRDYVTAEADYSVRRPNFEQQIKEAELAELVGSDMLIKGTNENGRGTRWYILIKETPKQYEIRSIGDYYIQDATAEQIKGYYTERITKEKLLARIDFPIETREIA